MLLLLVLLPDERVEEDVLVALVEPLFLELPEMLEVFDELDEFDERDELEELVWVVVAEAFFLLSASTLLRS